MNYAKVPVDRDPARFDASARRSVASGNLRFCESSEETEPSRQGMFRLVRVLAVQNDRR